MLVKGVIDCPGSASLNGVSRSAAGPAVMKISGVYQQKSERQGLSGMCKTKMRETMKNIGMISARSSSRLLKDTK